MKGLVPEEKFKPNKEGGLWKKSDTDKMLDLFFSGMTPQRIAKEMGRNLEIIDWKLGGFNEKDRCYRYQPICRISRKGARWTQNELQMVRQMRIKEVDSKTIARILARDEKELIHDTEGRQVHSQMKGFATTSDLLEAYQYLYYCAKKPIVSDGDYDALKEEECEFGPSNPHEDDSPRKKVVEYSARIRNLALYLLLTLHKDFKVSEDGV